jgi:glycine/D-amino acid oxidase-like deaminating enzyme
MEHPTVIVGAGMAGVCAALAISKRAPVLLADLASPEAASMAAVAGLANPIIPRRANLVWRSAEALSALEDLSRDIGVTPLHRGLLRPATSWDAMEGYRARAASHPHVARWYGPRESAAAWPWLQTPFGTLEVLQGGAFDIPAFVREGIRALESRGASIRPDWSLTGWRESDDSVEAVFQGQDGQHTFPCSRLILAPGAGFQRFPELARLRLHPLKGQLIVVEVDAPPENVCPVSGGGYMVPMGNHVIIGSSYEHQFDTVAPRPEVTSELLDRATASMPWLEAARVIEERAGIRVTVPGTRLPMVGPLPDHRNTWILSGLASRGLLMAPYLAANLSDWMADPAKVPDVLRVTLA